MPRKANQAEVEARIRALHAAGGKSQRQIAAEVRASPQFVNKVLKATKTNTATPAAAPQDEHKTPAAEGEPFSLNEQAPTGGKANKSNAQDERKTNAAQPAAAGKAAPQDERHTWVF